MTGRTVRWLWLVPATLLAVLLGAATPTAAQTAPDPGDQGDIPIAESRGTNPPEATTTVKIFVDVNEVLDINERDNTFRVTLTLTAGWIDKRTIPTNCQSTDPPETPTVYDGERATEQLKSSIWSPGFFVVEALGPRETSAIAVTADCNGIVGYTERFTTTVFQRFGGLNDFPFDEHPLSFSVAPFAQAAPGSIVFVPPNVGGNAFNSDEWVSEEWDFSGTSYADLVIDEDSAVITTVIRIERKWKFYWLNVIGPLLLIVAISWTVFWMDLNLAERLGVSITILLTVVAFDFLTSDNLPRLSYTTRLDSFYNVSYLAVAMTVLLSIIAKTRSRREQLTEDATTAVNSAEAARSAATEQRSARGVDEYWRYFYPVAYTCAVTLALTGAFSPGPAQARPPTNKERAAGMETEVAEALDQSARIDDLPLGEGRDATIEEPGDLHSYELCAPADGGTLSVKMERTGGDGDMLDPFLAMYIKEDDIEENEVVAPPSSEPPNTTVDPVPSAPASTDAATAATPRFVTADDNTAGGQDSIVVFEAMPGACYIFVAGDAGDATGSYRITSTTGMFEQGVFELSDVRLDLGVPLDELRGTATELVVDVPVTGSIEQRGEFDAYRLCSAGGGEDVSVVLRRTGPEEELLDPFLLVYADDGTLVDVDDDSAGGLDSIVVVPVTENECHLVIAQDIDREVGSYELTATLGAVELELQSDIEFVTGFPPGELFDQAESLPTSGSRSAELDSPGAFDVSRLCVSAGDGVAGGPFQATARPTGTEDQLDDPAIIVFADDGTRVAVGSDGDGEFGSQVMFDELDPGCYLVVAGSPSGGTGSFEIVTETG